MSLWVLGTATSVCLSAQNEPEGESSWRILGALSTLTSHRRLRCLKVSCGLHAGFAKKHAACLPPLPTNLCSLKSLDMQRPLQQNN